MLRGFEAWIMKVKAWLAIGVVMLSLIRTNLGITIRQNCPVPWRGCRGRGRGEIAGAIEKLLPFAWRRFQNADTLTAQV